MDPEEVPSSDSTSSPSRYDMDIYMRLYLEFYTIICLLSVISNVLLLVAIVKFKKLRKVTNIILAQFCALQVFYSLLTPVNLRVFDYVSVDSTTWQVYCLLGNIEMSIMCCMCFLLVLLLTDWYIKVYKQHNYGKFTHVYPFVIALIYFCLLCAVVVSAFPDNIAVFVVPWMCVAIAIFLTVYLIVLNIIHAVKKRQVSTNNTFNLGLIVCNITALCWCPTLVGLSIFGIYHPFFYILFVLIGFTSPIVMAIYLYMYEVNFNVFLGKILTCKCAEYTNEELLEDRVVYNKPEVFVKMMGAPDL